MAQRVLVVDDDEMFREIIVSMLVSANYECREAGDGLEALAVLESGEEFDLVISGIMMPEMDGIVLLERIKAKYPGLPVVIVTGVHDIQVQQLALRKGACHYLLKPFEREQILAAVRRALEASRLKRENDSTDMPLKALGNTLDLKNAEGEGHSKRVTAYTIAVARKMGLPKDEISLIARGAFLHDIGKMAIPDYIVRKAGKLTPEEAKIIQEHCSLGYKIISRIPFLAEAAQIVYSHHERYDGSGYPRGLKGDEIPLGARIFAVADTLDLMTADLPYREAQPFRAAREEIQRGSGRQFDPEIVRIFLDTPDNIWQDLRKDIDSQDNPLPPSDPPK